VRRLRLVRYAGPIGAVVLLIAAVVVIAVVIAAQQRAHFGQGSLGDIEAALRTNGMKICATTDNPNGGANQSLHSRQYDVALSCPSSKDAQVIVNEFGSKEDRDAAMRNLEVLVKPRGSGVAYTYAQFTVFIQGSSADTVQNRIDRALRAMGAK
jgi:hypothetical protein